MTNTENKRPKKLRSLLGLLIIGAIGSGLWDVLFKKIFFKIGELFINMVSYFNRSYVDHIYKSVGKGSNLEFYPSLVVILMGIFFPLVVILRMSRYFRREQSNNPANAPFSGKLDNYLFKTKRRAFVFMLVLTIPLSFIYTDILIKEFSTVKAYKYIDRSLEIVRPNMADSSFFALRSKFRQIDNKQKLQETLDLIKSIANSHNIDLPSYNLYGIK